MTTPERLDPQEGGIPGGSSLPDGAEEGPSLVGTSIGKYHIARKLGEGGMGSVFEAVHAEIGQRAAVKVLHAHLLNEPKFVRRFVDEARLISMVGHPGLVKIFDFTSTSAGAQCIVMEFLEGESLWSRFSRVKGQGGLPGMPAREVMQITRQVASALAAVHARGIVHRDLKPDNIMLVKDPDTPSGERAKVLDFGIAKLEGAEGRQTAAGVSLGTPTYMAPEQIEGKLATTERSDVYSLGVIMFELLSGEPPFKSETAGGILRQHLIREPPPLPQTVPPELQELVRLMMAKESAERPSMQQIVESLDGMADGTKFTNRGMPVVTSQRSLGGRSSEKSIDKLLEKPEKSEASLALERRRRIIMLALSLVVLTVVVLVGLGIARTQAAKTQPTPLVSPTVTPTVTPSLAAPPKNPPEQPTPETVKPKATPTPVSSTLATPVERDAGVKKLRPKGENKTQLKKPIRFGDLPRKRTTK